MKQLVTRLKPRHGYGHIVHIFAKLALPFLLFAPIFYGQKFGSAGFTYISVVVLLLSKWRMFAVRPRYWVANVRGNSVDIMVGLGAIAFMASTHNAGWQLLWAGLYSAWLVLLKPRTSIAWVSLQALIGQTVSMLALYIVFEKPPLVLLVLAQWVICYYAARHFFSIFEERHSRFLAFIWAYFAAGLAWVCAHWLLYYGFVAQPVLLLSVLGFGFGGLYYLDHNDRLSTLIRRQIIFVMMSIVAIVLVLSNWAAQAI